MNTLKKVAVAAAALIAASGTANAALVQLSYTGISNGQPPAGPAIPAVTTSSPYWTWDTVTGDLTAGSGTIINGFYNGPPVPPAEVFTQTITDLAISGAGVATASSYSCFNGLFAQTGLTRNVCAGYSFGANLTNESTVGPDGISPLTLGGDDFAAGAPQTLANNFNMAVRTFSGNILSPVGGDTLVVNKTGYNAAIPGNFQMTFTVVPVPAAGWLLVSALGLMGLARRQKAAA